MLLKEWIKIMLCKIKKENIYDFGESNIDIYDLVNNLCAKAYRVYGEEDRFGNVNPQEVSFGNSNIVMNDERAVITICGDVTNFYNSVIIIILEETDEECEKEFEAQLSDGIFENYKYGKIQEIKIN